MTEANIRSKNRGGLAWVTLGHSASSTLCDGADCLIFLITWQPRHPNVVITCGC